MTTSEAIRAYMPEPVLAGLAVSVCINVFGPEANSKFMHDEARDILSLGVVLLGAALALWIGLFWISNTAFGQWLASKRMLEPINRAYIFSAVILLANCVFCIICAHVEPTHRWLQISGEFLSFWGLASVPTLLNNTRHLLRLHALFGSQPRPVADIRSSTSKS